MVDEPSVIGDWRRSTKLGAGGFGEVWLWQHLKSKEKIAVKKCRLLPGQNVTTIKERWEREIDYMTNKIRHMNIVRGINVKPDAFINELLKFSPSELPILVMEYCGGGDLRKQLNDNRTANGMLESEVRNILQAMKNAIFCLHSMSITHRDIKPENICIQMTADGHRIYKLTDLGFAKTIDSSSKEASFVGTMEYVAPELIKNENYNCSVDYWSLGIIAYEMITGVRPFIPNVPLAQWIIKVHEKKSEHITIYEDDNGEFVYSNQIYPENQLSKKLNELLAEWLKLALEWNPKQRGCVFEPAKEPHAPPHRALKFFEMLDDILAKKILTIFVLTNHKLLGMECDETTTFDDLQQFIETEANIPKDKCHIIQSLEIGRELEKIGKFQRPIELYEDGYFDRPMIFVNQIGGVRQTSPNEKTKSQPNDNNAIVVELPAAVRNVLNNYDQRLKVDALRKFAKDTLFLIRNENDTYKTCLNGWYNYALQLNHEIELCKQNVRQMHCLVYGVKGALDLFDQTLKLAQDKLTDSMTWFEQFTKISRNTHRLVDAGDKITVRYQSLHRRSHDAYNNEILNQRNNHDFYDVANAAKAFDIVRLQISNKKFVDKPHYELFQCAFKCLKRRETLLHSPDFATLQMNLNGIHMEFIEIKRALEMTIAPAAKLRNDLMEMNQKLHERIWTQANSTNAVIESMNANHALWSTTNGNGAPDFQIGNAVSQLKDGFGNNIFCFGEGDNTKSLIDDNENLRIGISGLMSEIDEEFVSMKLDFNGTSNGHAVNATNSHD